MKRRVSKTASELITELAADPSYVEQQRIRDEEVKAKEAEYALAEAPIVRELRQAGATTNSVWELVNTTAPYPNLIPILLRHLDGPYPERVREGVARALAVREARPFWNILADRFLSETDKGAHGMKWALHLAVAEAADKSVLGELIRLALDRKLGRNRALMVDALARIGGPDAVVALDELASDPDLAGDVVRVRKRRRRNQVAG